MTEENKNKIEEELSKIKEEIQELKEILKQKRDNNEFEDDEEDYEDRPRRTFKFNLNKDFDDDEFNFDTDDIDITLNTYLGSVMQGVSDNIRRSVARATDGLDRMEINIARKAKREVEKELQRSKRHMAKSVRHMKKQARQARNSFHEFDSKTRIIHMEKLTEDELENFYESGSNLLGAISDQRRLNLLKLLEDGPAYQGDLSEKTGVKGGTFKHHMDLLMGAKYVYQEATRGRYLITRLGVEALKLAEILYRRFEFETKSSAAKVMEKVSEDEAEISDTTENDGLDTQDTTVETTDENLDFVEDIEIVEKEDEL
ncbi:MAG: hypothetical protein HeimC2_06650 [Candidatus Heimdallarchaeota archaeon LC_2]|nr:MAG: hypothetical protein HeimC2_06650 [Candidatus Heimdallarchaeota archaeon LC_2]